MAGNIIKINDLEWYISDDNMNELIDWLNTDDFKIKCKINMIDSWLKEIISDVKTYVQVIYDDGECKPGSYEFKKKIKIYTNNHEYTIVAIDRSSDDGYLGCVVSNRKLRAGENWTRGNDLPDGPFIQKTWEKIKNAIIRFELIKILPKVNNEKEDQIR